MAKNIISGSDNLASIIDKKFNIKVLSKILLIATILIITLINLKYSSNPILDRYGFRQTQTALTAYYMEKNGFSFNYETPVIGMPWSVPFEFPIYQFIVAEVAKLFHAPLAQTGRIISLIFQLLTCIPIFKILNGLKIERSSIYFTLALFLSSPIYIFWAGSFMIESSALFFAIYFLLYSVKIIQGNWSPRNLLFFSFFLLLASLQKITTAIPIILLVLFIITFFSIKLSDFRFKRTALVFIFIGILIPILASYTWIRYSDFIKNENIIGMKLTSSALSGWNFGPLTLRYSISLWRDAIYIRNIKEISFGFFGLLSILFTLILSKDRLTKNIIYGSLILFIAPFLIFTNLHFVHSYYQTANDIFLSIAVGLSICFLCNKYLSGHKYFYSVILILCVLSNLTYFYSNYYFDKTTIINNQNNKILRLTDFIRNRTPINQPVIWLGLDWTSEPAFYSERRSLTVPDWDSFMVDSIAKTHIFLGKENPSALVLCQNPKFDLLKTEIIKKYPQVIAEQVDDCLIYLLPMEQY